MTRRSTVTVRETPVQKVSSVTAGSLVVRSEDLLVETDDRIEVVDLTDRLIALLSAGFGLRGSLAGSTFLVDYAYTDGRDLGRVDRLSLEVEF